MASSRTPSSVLSSSTLPGDIGVPIAFKFGHRHIGLEIGVAVATVVGSMISCGVQVASSDSGQATEISLSGANSCPIGQQPAP